MEFNKKKLQFLIERYLNEFKSNYLEVINKIPLRRLDDAIDSHFIDLHLAVEECIDEYLVTFMGDKFDLKKINLKYEQKIYLAKGLEYLFWYDDLYRGVILINKTRNKISHRLGHVLTDNDINDIWGTLGVNSFTRKAIDGTVNGKNIENFGAIEKVIFLKYMLPVAIKSYTNIWRKWIDLKKSYHENEEVINLVKSMIQKDFNELEKL